MSRTSDAPEKLLAAALDLIWRNSYGSTSVDDICEQAGVKKGSFYHFFESKSELACAALDSEWNEQKHKLNEFFSPVVPPLDRLRLHFDYEVAIQKQLRDEYGIVCGCPLVSLGSEMGTQDQILRARIQKLLDEYSKYYESAIRDALATGAIPPCNPQFTTLIVTQYIHGALVQARIANSLEPILAIHQGILHILGVPALSRLPALA